MSNALLSAVGRGEGAGAGEAGKEAAKDQR